MAWLRPSPLAVRWVIGTHWASLLPITKRRRTLKRDFFLVAVLWAVLTAVAEALAFGWNPFPLAASEQATVIDDAFRVLMILGAPVLTFVIATVIYVIFRFRRKGEPTDDGPPVWSHKPAIAIWLAVTTALTLLVIVFPGVTGLHELRAHSHEEPDLVVEIRAGQWFWMVTYPEYGVTTTRELMLPVDKLVRFEVTSADVLHAFWVPAFRSKIDAVPGMTTTVDVTPTKIGSFDEDPTMRLQCAELCGLGHSVMKLPVRVVEPGEFEAWAAQNSSG
jgi:cytochrome c oxidase subunit 2